MAAKSRSNAASRNFVLLPENRLAVSAVDQFVDPGFPKKLPIVYVSGPSGVGKSMLAERFLRGMTTRDRTLKSAKFTASEFAAEFAEASAENAIAEFQTRYREQDILVIEDLQSLSGRRESLLQLQSLIDEVANREGRVLVSANCLPGELKKLPARLVSRFHGGVCVSIRMPGRASRTILLSQFSQTNQVPLSQTSVKRLAAQLKVSPRELHALVLQLEAAASAAHEELSLAFVDQYLTGDVVTQTVTVAEIARAVARHFDVTLQVLRSRGRENSLPRQLAMYLCRRLTTANHREIGHYFDGRDHSTVVHACRRLRELLPEDAALRRHLSRIEKNVRGTAPR